MVSVEVSVTKTNNGHNGITTLPESCYSSNYKVYFPSGQGLVTELTHITGKNRYQTFLKQKRHGFCLAYLGPVFLRGSHHAVGKTVPSSN